MNMTNVANVAGGGMQAARATGAASWPAHRTADRNAYRALLTDVTPYLRAVAARCFKEPSDAEDVVQDVLLTVHAIRHTYDPGRPFGPRLVAIANRRIVDRRRHRIRARSREIELSDEHETFSSDAATLHFDDASAAAVHRAIKSLRKRLRQTSQTP